MRYDNILIDVSNFYTRAYSVGENLTYKLEDGMEIVTGGIYNCIRMINSVKNKFLKEDGKIYFLFDNTNSGINKRKELDPDYKSNRTKKDDSFYRSIDLFHMILLNYSDNFYCVQKQGCEADDLVYPILQKEKDRENLLISNDIDWFRSISDKVHVAKYENKEYVIYTPVEFYEKFGFEATPTSLCMYKAIKGDGSDNIPNALPGIRSEVLERIVTDYRSIDDLLKKLDSNMYISDRFKEKIVENQARLKLNERLVSFEPINSSEIIDSIFECKFNAKTLHSIYKSLGFKISNIDPRVAQFYVKEEITENKNVSPTSFFSFDKIRRV